MAKDSAFSLEQARRLWCHKQRIQTADGDGPQRVLATTGWTRTLGGIDVYLALRARNPSLSRKHIDAAVATGAVRVVPAVRGCMYLAPGEDAELSLSLACELDQKRTVRELDKAGVLQTEVDTLATKVAKIVGNGPKTTAEVRKALPDGAVRSLGAAGKKVGLSSPLPVALRQLEFAGKIIRTPVGDTLDTEVYRWSVPAGAQKTFGIDASTCFQHSVERFLQWFGPATIKHMATWIGIAQRDVQQALHVLPVRSCTITGLAGEAYVLASEHSLLSDLPAPKHVAFLPFGDNLIHLHGGPAAMTDPAHHELEVRVWGGRGRRMTLGTCNHLGYRSIVVGDRLVGFWEYDPEADEVVTAYFGGPPRGYKTALARAITELRTALRDDIGHARSFRLDTDETLRTRANELRTFV